MNQHTEIHAYDTPEKRRAYIAALDATFMHDDYKFWRHALIGELLPNGDGDIQCGYYRSKRKGRDIDSCIAIWRKGEEIVCSIDGETIDPNMVASLWNYFKAKPVTHFEYGWRLREGTWPNSSGAVIGHNQAPLADTPEAIQERIDDLVREAKRLIEQGAAGDKATADQASDLANTLGELEAKSDKLRVAEKEPHLEAGRAVDRKWAPIRDLAGEFKARLKAVVVTPFLRKQAAEIEEQNRKAAEAAAAANEKARAEAMAAGGNPDEAPVVAPTVVRNTAGSSKRSTGLRTVTSANVTDWVALLTHLAHNEKIREVAQKIADANAKSGTALPGCEIIKQQNAA